MDYMSTDFGANSSSHFPLKYGQTDRPMRINALLHTGGYTAGMDNENNFETATYIQFAKPTSSNTQML